MIGDSSGDGCPVAGSAPAMGLRLRLERRTPRQDEGELGERGWGTRLPPRAASLVRMTSHGDVVVTPPQLADCQRAVVVQAWL